MKKYTKFLPFLLLGLCLVLNSCSPVSTEEMSQDSFLANSKNLNNTDVAFTADYFNSVIKAQGLKDVFIKKTYYANVESILLKELNIQSFDNYFFEESMTVDLDFGKNAYTFHIVPLKNDVNRAHLYIDQSGIINSEYIEVDISNQNDFYHVYWKKQQSLAKSDHDCDEGSSDVMKIGGAIAFAGFFGCVPCPFVGGAVATVAGVRSLFCP